MAFFWLATIAQVHNWFCRMTVRSFSGLWLVCSCIKASKESCAGAHNSTAAKQRVGRKPLQSKKEAAAAPKSAMSSGNEWIKRVPPPLLIRNDEHFIESIFDKPWATSCGARAKETKMEQNMRKN